MYCIGQKVKSQQQNKKANKNPCQSQESRPLARQSKALPLGHRVNITYRFQQNGLTLST